jgi:hypothetical protein
MKRFVLALACLFVFSASADAAAIHRFTPRRPGLPAHERVVVRPPQHFGAPARFAVPGWTNGQTEYWLDSATAAAGLD